MYHLITFPAGFGAFSFSPFCTKAAWMLAHAGVTWQRQDENDPRKYPHGKLPCLQAGDQLIHDSTQIGAFLEQQGADFWGPATARDKAFGHALIRMSEEHIYFHGIIDRWMNDDAWPHIRDTYFHEIPKVVRGVITGKIRKDLRKGLHEQGLMRLTEDERAAKLEADLQAILTLLDDQPFLLGDTPTLPDFSVASVLLCLQRGPVETRQTQRIAQDPQLAAYTARMQDRYE